MNCRIEHRDGWLQGQAGVTRHAGPTWGLNPCASTGIDNNKENTKTPKYEIDTGPNGQCSQIRRL